MPIASVAPLPRRLLPLTVVGSELVPAWFTDRDRPWLRDLLATSEAFAGRPFDELARAWRRWGDDPRSGRRAPIARFVLARLLTRRATTPARTAVRQELFAAAAVIPREQALASVAARHGFAADQLVDRLFDDLPHARSVAWPDPPPEPTWLGLLTNLSIARGLLRHARAAELELHGASRAVLRSAWLHGDCFVCNAGSGFRLRWRATHRGPARGLAAIAPVLPWARRFVLRAHCQALGLDGTFVLTTGDPILPGAEPRHFDSDLERTFATEWATASCLDLRREPHPVVVEGRLHFPDFAITDALGDEWLLEIAGLRDRRALPHRLAVLAAMPRYVLCLPRRLVPADFAGHPRIVPFARRVRAHDVCRALRRLQADFG